MSLLGFKVKFLVKVTSFEIARVKIKSKKVFN